MQPTETWESAEDLNATTSGQNIALVATLRLFYKYNMAIMQNLSFTLPYTYLKG